MMEDNEIRRAVLRTLITSRFSGVANAFANAVQKPASQINDMLAEPPRKSFGAKIARQLEKKLGLEDFFFERKENIHTLNSGGYISISGLPVACENTAGISENPVSMVGETGRGMSAEQTQLVYNQLSSEEQELVIAWRHCNQEQREMFRLLVNQVAKNATKAA